MTAPSPKQQTEILDDLLDLLREDHDVDPDLTSLDLLDYMAILGVALVPSDAATSAYNAHLDADVLAVRRASYDAWRARGDGCDDLTLRAAAHYAQDIGDARAERIIDGVLKTREALR